MDDVRCGMPEAMVWLAGWLVGRLVLLVGLIAGVWIGVSALWP